MALENPDSFQEGSFYLLKNEKMIMLVQVIERGSHYMTVTTRGAELQETTVCHDEENGNINELAEEIFEKRKWCKPNFLFSLSPLKQIHFDLY